MVYMFVAFTCGFYTCERTLLLEILFEYCFVAACGFAVKLPFEFGFCFGIVVSLCFDFCYLLPCWSLFCADWLIVYCFNLVVWILVCSGCIGLT